MENRRHHLIILGSFQRRLISGAVMASILLINLALIASLLIEPELLSRIDTMDTVALALIEVAIIALIFFVSLLASNKIAGPMYAFDKTLEQIRSGDLMARLHLRPGDICHDVAREMNETFDDLNSRITALKETTAKLQQLDCNDSTQQKLIEELHRQLDHFNNKSPAAK